MIARQQIKKKLFLFLTRWIKISTYTQMSPSQLNTSLYKSCKGIILCSQEVEK